MKKNPNRFIVHVDMDAFFASVEQRDNPQYRDKPVVIGADPKGGKGRGVVSTCSYQARKFGVRSAMPISIAYQKCPQAVFLGVDMEKYARVSGEVFSILGYFSPLIEGISIDEAFLDISDTYKLWGTPYNTCVEIKKRIKEGIGLTVSVGLAPTKMAAKIASDLKKPDGLVEVKKDSLVDFLWPLDVSRIWGIGPKTQEILRGSGINTIGDLAKRGKDTLINLFGKNGIDYWQMAQGIDESEVSPYGEAKSISSETTFSEDTNNEKAIERELINLCEEVSYRLRHEGFKSRNITLKIRLEGFKTYTRSVTIPDPTNLFDIIYKEAKRLYNNFDRNNRKVRLLGVRTSGFNVKEEQYDLFKTDGEKKKEKVHLALDKIRQKFGSSSIYRGS
ncbi:DNA polymerase IV [bacterium]|nr:MAG: DNA polymerase IV [bacterium]